MISMWRWNTSANSKFDIFYEVLSNDVLENVNIRVIFVFIFAMHFIFVGKCLVSNFICGHVFRLAPS